MVRGCLEQHLGRHPPWEIGVRILFWVCFAVIGYAYFGYLSLLWLEGRLCRRPVFQAPIFPTVSIIMAVRNEEASLPAKLENLRSLKYPVDKLQIVIASDGSTDGTATILTANTSTIVPVINPQSNGKASALNAAVRHSTGEILVFQDARQVVEQNVINELVSCFADRTVGAVSGELLLETSVGSSPSEGLGVYWKIEKLIRKLESNTGSVVGVTGAIYAVRRELYPEIPEGTILDDVYVPMHVIRMGRRVVFQSSAIARDRLFSEKGKEFSRKVRTLTGNYQLLQLSPWLLSNKNPILFRFISHKLLRLIVPLLLIVMFGASGLAGGPLYLLFFGLQLLFYALAVLGIISPYTMRFTFVSITNAFLMLNVAAVLAFYNFIVGRNAVWSSGAGESKL
jgi:biofilm PGA synthesis N-glycosyltransferase PgaC